MAQVESPPVALALPCCGLGNRIRTIFSAAMAAPNPIVIWQPSSISGSQYSDVFERHPDFRVVDVRRWRSSDYDRRCQLDVRCVRWEATEQRTSAQAGPSRRLGEAAAPASTSTSAAKLRKQQRKHASTAIATGPPTRTCASLDRDLGYDELFAAASATMLPRYSIDGVARAPVVFRGCGMRFTDPIADPLRCMQLARALRPTASLRALVARLLPDDPRRAVGVHLRPPDAELDIGGPGVGVASVGAGVERNWTAGSGHAPSAGGRRLSQGRSLCHPVPLYARMVAQSLASDPRLAVVYVATGSLVHLDSFKRELAKALHAAGGVGEGHGGVAAAAVTAGQGVVSRSAGRRHPPRVLSLPDLLALPGAPQLVPRPAEEGPYAGGGRDTVYGVQGATLDLWALASTSKVFRSGESTFGMLAAAMHRTPEEIVVHDSSNPGCKAWSQMFAVNGTPAFCAAKRGVDEPRACPCAS